MSDPQNLQAFPPPPVDDRALFDLSLGLYGYYAVVVAFELGLFARLAQRPATAEEIARHFGLGARSTEALLLSSLSLGLLERQRDRYGLSPTGRTYLLPESRTYFGDYIQEVVIDQWRMTSLPAVRRAVLEEHPQVNEAEAVFASMPHQEEQARIFTRRMHGHSIASALAWPLRFDLAEVGHMVDVGGGSGAHAIGAALRWPQLTATVFEMATVAPVAEEFVQQYALAERIAVARGDFWAEPLPAGDLHFYGDIFHDWPDERCPALMAKSFAALPPGGRIMIHEVLYDDDKSGPFQAAAHSVAMLVWTEGRQRSGPEYGAMLEAAGFAEVAVDRVFGYWGIVSARKPR